jgi:hypothetical protein
MLGIKLRDRVKSEDIRKRTKIIDALEQVARLKWKWAGHVARINDGRWSHQVIHWQYIDGTRRRGRPLQRWKDDVSAIAGNLWTRQAQDRNKWLEMEEAFIQRWMIPI